MSSTSIVSHAWKLEGIYFEGNIWNVRFVRDVKDLRNMEISLLIRSLTSVLYWNLLGTFGFTIGILSNRMRLHLKTWFYRRIFSLVIFCFGIRFRCENIVLLDRCPLWSHFDFWIWSFFGKVLFRRSSCLRVATCRQCSLFICDPLAYVKVRLTLRQVLAVCAFSFDLLSSLITGSE